MSHTPMGSMTGHPEHIKTASKFTLEVWDIMAIVCTTTDMVQAQHSMLGRKSAGTDLSLRQSIHY